MESRIVLLLRLVCLRVCGRHVFKDRRAYLFLNLNMQFRIGYFSDMPSNSYPTWNFSLLKYFAKKTFPLIKSLRCSLQHLNFTSNSYRPMTLKKSLLYVIKTHSMGPSKQIRHEYLIRKTFLLRVNHDDNRKKAFLGLGQLKHHSLIKTFQKPKTKVGKTVSREPQWNWLKILMLS